MAKSTRSGLGLAQHQPWPPAHVPLSHPERTSSVGQAEKASELPKLRAEQREHPNPSHRSRALSCSAGQAPAALALLPSLGPLTGVS